MSFLTKIFGSRNERILRRLRKQVAKINKMEPAFEALSDDELRAKTDEFRSRLANGETLQQLLPEAFATVREAGKRVLGMRHFDVQLIGGMVLTNRCIAEMRTGEGKTLTATLPCYLMALRRRGSGCWRRHRVSCCPGSPVRLQPIPEGPRIPCRSCCFSVLRA